MKKFLLALLVFAVSSGLAFAFEFLSYPPPLSGGGNLMIDAGAGLTPFYGSGYGNMLIPPLFLNVEYALPVNVPISVGGFAAFSRYTYKYHSTDNWGWQHNFITFGGRANWHWSFDVKWLDLYSGIWAGYLLHLAKWVGSNSGSYSSPSFGGFDFGGQVGAHFYFGNNIGLVLESGYPFALKVGVALKLNSKRGSADSASIAQPAMTVTS